MPNYIIHALPSYLIDKLNQCFDDLLLDKLEYFPCGKKAQPIGEREHGTNYSEYYLKAPRRYRNSTFDVPPTCPTCAMIQLAERTCEQDNND